MSLTIGELSRRLGLSISTVSKALNNYPDVSEETRSLVADMARKLGYEPSASARSLRRGHTDKIGLLINHSLSYISEYLAEVIVGAAYSAEQNGKNIVLYTDTIHQPDGLLRICRSGEIDGALLLWANPTIDTLRQLEAEGMPCVILGRRVDYERASFVAPDNYGGAWELTRHLIEQGHRRIGFMARPEHGLTHADRLGGYYRALKEAGIPIGDELVIETRVEPNSGYKAMKRLLGLPRPPTAVFAFYDLMAVEALRAAADCGLRVPNDMAVVGFDGLPSSLHTTPPISTARQPLERMGREAVRLLEARIKNPTRSPDRIIHPVEICLRESSQGTASSRND